MVLQYGDRVQETFATTGTGGISLGGPVVGYQAFSSTCNNGDTCFYAATDGTNWEVGLGTYTTSGNLLERTTILGSSNAGSAVSWGAGTKNIWLTAPATFFAATQHIVTGSRALNTVYHNTTNKLMIVEVLVQAAALQQVNCVTDNLSTPIANCGQFTVGTNAYATITFVVIPGNYYEIITGGTATLETWTEIY